MLRRAHFSLFLPLILTSAIASSQAIDPAMRAQIDQVIQRCVKADGTPSASVAVVIDGHVAYANAFGAAVLSPRQPATSTTRYQLASISKTFTAQAILLLVADGKVSLNDPVSRWYPDLTSASQVTVRQLLNHTSGYPDHYPEGYPAGPRGAAATPDSIIAEWGHHPLLFAPGTQFHYSNLEYEIAGRIVEKVSGQPLFQFLQQRIFVPLQMTSVMDLDTIPDGSPALATGYVQHALAPLQPAPYEGPGWSFGAGQVVTTAEDVARWDAAFLAHRVLPPQEAAEEGAMTHLANGSVYPAGLGIFVSREDAPLRYYHTGQGLGFEAINLIYPESRVAIVVLTNTNVRPTYHKIADELAYLLVPPNKDEIFARNLFARLVEGRPDRSLFGDDLNRYMTDAMLAQYRSTLGSLGPVESFATAGVHTTDGLESRDYDVTAGGHALKLHLLLLPDGRLEDASIADASMD